MSIDARKHAPAAERNREPILAVLRQVLPASGMVLDTVTRGRREMKLLAYLRYGAPGDQRRE